MRLKFYLVLTLFLISCKKNSDFTLIGEKDFKEIKNIEGGEVILENEIAAIQLITTEDFLILRRNNGKSVFSIYSLKDLKLLGRFGGLGKGPNEFVHPYITSNFYNNKIGGFWVNDLSKYRLTFIDVNSSLKKDSLVLNKVLYIHPKYDFTHDVTVINDSVIFGNHGPNQIVRSRVSKYNYKKDKIESFNLLPLIEDVNIVSRGMQYTLYFDNLCVNSDKSKMVSSMSKFDRIDFYNIENSQVFKTIIGDSYMDNGFNINDFYDRKNNSLVGMKNYNYSLFSTEKLIYVLYRNGENIEDNGKVDNPVQIRTYDWNGNPISVYKLPNDLINFSVDEKRGFFYGIDYYNEAIYRYKYK